MRSATVSTLKYTSIYIFFSFFYFSCNYKKNKVVNFENIFF